MCRVRKKQVLKYLRVGSGFGLGIGFLLLSVVALRIAIAFQQVPIPQAIFLLGGDFDRTTYAAQMWQSRQTMEIWVSDFQVILPEQEKRLILLGVSESKIHLDGRATDTVTNFTSLVDQFESRGFRHVYLVTSDYHMQRARTIATVVFGSRGIVVTPITVHSIEELESGLKSLRDFGRSLLWLVTGKTGASLNPQLKEDLPAKLRLQE